MKKGRMIIYFELDNNDNVQSYKCQLDCDIQIYSLVGVLHAIQNTYLMKPINILMEEHE